MTFWLLISMEYDTFPNARDGMDGGDDDQWLLLVIYRLRKGSSITFHFFSFYIYSGNINLEIYKNEKIVNRNQSKIRSNE